MKLFRNTDPIVEPKIESSREWFQHHDHHDRPMSAKNSAEGAQKIVEIGSNSATRVNAQRPVLSHNAQRPGLRSTNFMQPGWTGVEVVLRHTLFSFNMMYKMYI